MFCPPENSKEYAVTGQFWKLYYDLAQLKTPQVHRFPQYSVHYQDPDSHHPLIGLWHDIISFFLWQQLAKLTKKRKLKV